MSLNLQKRVWIVWVGCLASVIALGQDNVGFREVVPSNNSNPAVRTATTTNSLSIDNLQDYRVDSEDTLEITVIGIQELTQLPFKVSSTGQIDYPYLGLLDVKGRTLAQVRQTIRDLLDRDYIVDPQVVIIVSKFKDRMVSVIGAVQKGGMVPLRPDRPTTIVEALALAGGFAPSANKSKIEVTRDGKTTRFSFSDLQSERDPSKIYYLKPGDVINVRESFL